MKTDYTSRSIRPGCKDMWNAFMVKDAEFSLGSDIPICPCTAKSIPTSLISYVNAKHIHKTTVKDNPDYHIDAYVHFYVDDQKFDGPKSGIWNNSDLALAILHHFSGIITPDFSTFLDFPDAIKRYNTYRMRAFGYWASNNGIPVINNVRWGSEETWDYCFDGIPYGSIVSIGTVASKTRLLEYRLLFNAGLKEMVRLLHPSNIIVYGSSKHMPLEELNANGISIICFESDTSKAFSSFKNGGKGNE